MMRLAMLILALAATPATAAPAPTLDEALAGRTAGKAVDCIPLRTAGSSMIIPGEAIVYRSSRRIWYVNRPAGGCTSLRRDRTIVVRIPGTRLCQGDLVTIVDPVTRFDYGSCPLGNFTPYAR